MLAKQLVANVRQESPAWPRATVDVPTNFLSQSASYPPRYSLCQPPLRLRGVTRRRYLEAAPRPLATLAMLLDVHTRNLGYQRFCQAANLRVLRRHAAQRAAIAPDEYRTISFLEFSEATQLVEHLNRRLQPRVRPIRLRGIVLFG
jgi:hypothetical protein